MSFLFCVPGCHFLQPNEQLVVRGWTDKSVINGPGFKIIGGTKVASKREAITLTPMEYMHIEDTLNGTLRMVSGPQLFFLGAFETIKGRYPAIALKQNQYVRILNSQTGQVKIIKGEGQVFLEPAESVQDGGVQNAIEIDDTKYVIVRDLETAELVTITEKQLFFPTATQVIVKVNTPEVLDQTEYIHVEDLVSGDVALLIGPMKFCCGPYERIAAKGKAISLNHFEYLKLLNTKTGEISVEKGEKIVYPGPFDSVLEGGKKKAVQVDELTAVLIRDTKTGQLDLITEKQLFFPNSHQQVVEERAKIVLEDPEVMILKDKDGRYHFKAGTNPDERSFFLPPYWTIEEVKWTNGQQVEQPKRVNRFDMRPQFLTYQFTARTCDNVELILDITFFWQIICVEKMIRKTDDAPGDLCNHARSCVIQLVSKVTLEKFLSEFNAIARAAILDPEDTFYEERGFIIHRVEIHNISCKDPKTEKVLREIIEETINRLKSLQKQQSDNEVKIFKLKGDIAEEKLNGELLAIKRQHVRNDYLMRGEAEADKVHAFLQGVGDIPLEKKLELFHTLRKCEALASVAKTNTTMYFTPSDVNLSIETVQTAKVPLVEHVKSFTAAESSVVEVPPA